MRATWRGSSSSACAASMQVATASGRACTMLRRPSSALAFCWSNSSRASYSSAPADRHEVQASGLRRSGQRVHNAAQALVRLGVLLVEQLPGIAQQRPCRFSRAEGPRALWLAHAAVHFGIGAQYSVCGHMQICRARQSRTAPRATPYQGHIAWH